MQYFKEEDRRKIESDRITLNQRYSDLIFKVQGLSKELKEKKPENICFMVWLVELGFFIVVQRIFS